MSISRVNFLFLKYRY